MTGGTRVPGSGGPWPGKVVMLLPSVHVGIVQVKSMVVAREMQSGSAWLSAARDSGEPVMSLFAGDTVPVAGDRQTLALQDVGGLTAGDLADLGLALTALRKASGHTQQTLANVVPWARSTISNVERGSARMPRAFWGNCDAAVGAGGRLLALFDRLTPTWSPAGQHAAGACEHCGCSGVRKPVGVGWPA